MAVNCNPPMFEKDVKDVSSDLFSLDDIFDEFLFQSDRPQPPVNVREQSIIANVPINGVGIQSGIYIYAYININMYM
jgi:hypothetical protein